jgi:hypothetical protein
LIYRVATGAELPRRLPVGRDAIDRLGAKIDQLRADRDRWRDAAVAVAHDGD